MILSFQHQIPNKSQMVMRGKTIHDAASQLWNLSTSVFLSCLEKTTLLYSCSRCSLLTKTPSFLHVAYYILSIPYHPPRLIRMANLPFLFVQCTFIWWRLAGIIHHTLASPVGRPLLQTLARCFSLAPIPKFVPSVSFLLQNL